MGNDAINWDEVPDIITKEQLYRLCHIGKAKAQYLLQNNLIPCEYTGKMTRCYKIKKEDVRTYLERRDQFPEDYSPPGRWYVCLRPPKTPEAPEEVAAEMRLFYERKLESYLDVIPAKDIAALTGYGKTTVNKLPNHDPAGAATTHGWERGSPYPPGAVGEPDRHRPRLRPRGF